MERNLNLVAQNMRKHYVDKGSDTSFIDDIIKSSLYTAPELMSEKWDELAEFVNHTIPFPPKEEVDLKIVAEFMGLSYEEAVTRFQFSHY